MFKFIIFLLLISQTIAFYGQENLAENYIRQIEGKLNLAKANIDKEILDPVKSKDPQTWYLRAYIYTEISKSTVYNGLCSNPAEVALESINKCYENDGKTKFYSECVNVLFDVGTSFYDKAIKAYNTAVATKDTELFKTALVNFEFFFSSIAIMGEDVKMIGHLLEYNKINQNSIKVYAGYSAQSSGDFVKAKKYYNELIDMKSDITTARKKGLPLAYIYMVDLLKAENNLNEATLVVKRGIDLYPDNSDLVTTGVDLYFQTDKLDDLAGILEIAVTNNPSDIQFLSVLAGSYNKIYKLYVQRGYASTADDYRKKAIATYDKAIALNPSDKELQFKLYYNCGLLHYNPGVKLYITKDESKTEEWTALFKGSLKYLEKAHELDPSHKNLINILMKVYQSLNETDKAKALEELLYK